MFIHKKNRYEEFTEKLLMAGFNIWTLIWLVIILGIAISYFTNMLFDLYWKNQILYGLSCSMWNQLIITGIIIILCIVAGFLINYRDRTTLSTVIDMVIPFQYRNDEINIQEIPQYHPSRIMRTQFSNSLNTNKKKHEYESFIKSFGKHEKWQRNLHEISLTRVYNLVEYMLLHTLNEFGRKSLGKHAKFVTGADLYEIPPIKDRKISEFKNCQAGLKSYFIKNDKDFEKRNFIMLKRIKPKLKILPKKGFIEEDGAENIFSIELKSPFGSVQIIPSQIWTEIKAESQAGQIFIKNLPPGKNWNVLAVSIRIMFSANFKRSTLRLLFNRSTYKAYSNWMVSELFAFFQRKLDWNRFIETDIDRKIVQIEQKLNEINKKIDQ